MEGFAERSARSKDRSLAIRAVLFRARTKGTDCFHPATGLALHTSFGWVDFLGDENLHQWMQKEEALNEAVIKESVIGKVSIESFAFHTVRLPLASYQRRTYRVIRKTL